MVLEYSGDPLRLKDMLRGSILCLDLREMRNVLQGLRELENQGILRIVQIKNRFRGAAGPGGYRDMNINILFDGLICEVQIHSLAHYQLKKNAHPIYVICRSFGLVGELDDDDSRILSTTFASAQAFQITGMSLTFAFRTVLGAWCTFLFVLYTLHGFSARGTFALGLAEPFKTCKVLALSLPYLLTATLGLADIWHKASATTVTVHAVSVLAGACSAGYASDTLGGGGGASEGSTTNASLPVIVYMCVALLLSATLFSRQIKVHPSSSSKNIRIGLLYARYFGLNGKFYTLKLGVLNAAQIVFYAFTQLPPLGEQVKDGRTEGFYCLLFIFFAVASVFPFLFLHQRDEYRQRVGASYAVMTIDVVHTLLWSTIIIAISRDVQQLLPSDFFGFLSTFLPVVHILSLTRAIESWKKRHGFRVSRPVAWKGARHVSPHVSYIHCISSHIRYPYLRWTPSFVLTVTFLPHSIGCAGLILLSLAATGFSTLVDRSIYPVGGVNPLAPCTLRTEGIDVSSSSTEIYECSNRLGLSSDTLNFDGRNITGVLPSVFGGVSGGGPERRRALISLRTLSLEGNALSKMEGLESPWIETLDLSFNFIDTLTPFVPVVMAAANATAEVRANTNTNATTRSLRAPTSNSVLTAKGLAEMVSLRELDLSHNRLTVIGAGALKGMPALRTLVLDSNPLVSIEANAFDGMSDLQVLSLRNASSLRNVDVAAFETLTSLQELYVDGAGAGNVAWEGIAEVLPATVAIVTSPPTAVPSLFHTAAPTGSSPMETVVISSNPTAVPSSSPTTGPSGSPTVALSRFPTAAPSDSSHSHTRAPTSAPTVNPTPLTFPIHSPSPTETPTESPTEAPTASPTASPNEARTPVPSKSPTPVPSETPTGSPTKNPTELPTALPIESPTNSPTATCIPRLSLLPLPLPTIMYPLPTILYTRIIIFPSTFDSFDSFDSPLSSSHLSYPFSFRSHLSLPSAHEISDLVANGFAYRRFLRRGGARERDALHSFVPPPSPPTINPPPPTPPPPPPTLIKV
jgi:hypothetical protein